MDQLNQEDIGMSWGYNYGYTMEFSRLYNQQTNHINQQISYISQQINHILAGCKCGNIGGLS